VTGIVLDRTLSPTACQIEFAAMSETAIYATVQATVAGYAISLAPGNYSVYGVQVGGQGVYLGTVEIAPTGNRSLDITLVQGLRFSGTTLREGVAGEALIEVSGDSELSRTSAPDGSFDILLPEGTYALKCSASGTEKGVVVSYRASLTIDLAADLSRAISLSKLPARSVELQWDSREKMALMPGETAVYNLRIVNTGNVPEVIEMSADAGNWEVEFSQERVSLDFGPVNSQWITVSVTPAVGSAVIHAPIMITATSTADATAQKSVYVDVDILPVYAVNLSFDKPYSTTGETYSYSLKVRNNGNIEDVYDIEIAGAEELLSLGWETALQREESGPMANLTLDVLPGKQKFFDIFLTPTRQNPEPNVQVIVVATSQNSADSYSIFILEPQLPKLVLPASGVSVTGDEVYYAVAGVPAETLVLVGVTIAVLSIFTLLSYQRGVFRRRRR